MRIPRKPALLIDLQARLRGRPARLLRRATAVGLLIAGLFELRHGDPAPAAVATPPPAPAADSVIKPAADGESIVPIRLADAAVAELLHPGSKIDLVSVGRGPSLRQVLASMASVVQVRTWDGEARHGPPSSGQGPMVLVSLPADVATQVAASSLGKELAVTLR
ncbi:hypothetical protein SAMN05421504_103978 [Amycolatopsis xylanica]|uniref:Flp pilus assembly protein CpaB n=1 Tax=Amycolatopsis xylanica TaxID=589385 RepID=A0A1H3EVM7_9PSEU|nr:hypothetical protein [Amycolatopsis xylanica]SDX82128.1 hypothetical protein SAMN05421504_103978 [Amycolatopsis xylanica]